VFGGSGGGDGGGGGGGGGGVCVCVCVCVCLCVLLFHIKCIHLKSSIHHLYSTADFSFFSTLGENDYILGGKSGSEENILLLLMYWG
jgi:hypothetical protein